MRISDWSSDVCSSDLWQGRLTEIIKTGGANVSPLEIDDVLAMYPGIRRAQTVGVPHDTLSEMVVSCVVPQAGVALDEAAIRAFLRSEEHTSELQSLMRISYAVFCLKNKKQQRHTP